MHQNASPLCLGILITAVVCFISCAAAGMPGTNVSKDANRADSQMPSDPCEKARALEAELVSNYGNPDFTCTTSYINGVIVKIWCCVEGKRIVYYSFGYEHGCRDSGYEIYQCGSTELPASVRSSIENAGERNECRVLLEERKNPCRN